MLLPAEFYWLEPLAKGVDL
ncbi:Protein of unknown function [Bacillus cereus]|nr:Protein of unknown function [Bacillus cereus]